jgi:hypothetical protein
MTHRSRVGTCFTLAVLIAGCASTGGVPEDNRALYVTQHPEVEPRFASAILSGNVLIGMTPDMVHAAWGEPTRVEKTPGDTASDEKWIYGNYLVNSAVTLLYFKGEELVLYEFFDTQTNMSQSITDPSQNIPLKSGEVGGSKNGPN